MDTPQNPVSQNQPAPVAPGGQNNDMLMAILAYIGPLVIVSYIVAGKHPTVKFHIGQGLVLLVIEAVVWVVDSMFYTFAFFTNILFLAALVFSIIGIVNVVQGKQKELPLIGHLSKHFPL